MRNKLICIVTVIIMICICSIATLCNVNETVRIHQHIQNKKEVKTEMGDFNSHLPILTVNTNGQKIPGESRDGSTIKTEIKIYDDETKNNYLTDEPKITTFANIRYRGNSSMKFDKKGYLIKLMKEDGTKNEQEIMGMSKHNEWVLHGPYLDKTLIRNYMWYNISAEIMEYAPNVRFCEIFVDGKYNGIYVMTESISRGINGRISIDKYDKKDPVTGYIIRLDRGEENPFQNLNNFSKYTNILGEKLRFDVVYPSKTFFNSEIKKYIENDYSKFEKALYSFDYKKYAQYIDVDNFVEYFLINEFTKNYDAGSCSTYLYKNLREKYKLCVWDFNNCCDNFQEKSMRDEEFSLLGTVWYRMLFKDDQFTEKVIQKYWQLRKTYFNEEYLNNYIDDTLAYLGDAVDRNFEVWGYTFEKNDLLKPEERNIKSKEEAVKQLKEFIAERIKYLDNNIETLRQYSHESKVKKFNH